MARLLGTLLSMFLLMSFSNAQSNHSEVQFVKNILRDKKVNLDQIYITDHYESQGITHTYFKQSIGGIPIFNSRGAIHYKTRDQIIVKPQFIPIPKNIKPRSIPTLTAKEAILQTASKKNLDLSGEIDVLNQITGEDKQQTFRASKISLQEIKTSLYYYIIDASDMRLVWSIPIEDIKTAYYAQYLVDAHTGAIIEEISWTVSCNHGTEYHSDYQDIKHEIPNKLLTKSTSVAPNTYEVFAWPVESPNFGTRTVESSPWNDNLIASPNGWHNIGSNDYSTTRGNNTDTYLDDDYTNSPTGGDSARADGGANLEFIFPLDINLPPTDYKEAAITNCFYWTNLMHDVWFNYGFDEASGNFQEENYTANGSASDYVRSEVQDGPATCNANFGTPPDGSNPRMQMYLCTKNGNFRDGDLDNGVIAHEIGHGISNRLTGGPSASGCLGNAEQMGEGWSDYFGMVMTIETGDIATDSRGMGTWLFGQGPSGNGIRPYPYSTDFGVNPMTYNTIKNPSISQPHGIGSVWCTMLWEMTWDFIDTYGFDTDIYNGTGGNNIAMQLVMEGLKLQPCSPGFVEGRDAILEADLILNGGVNDTLIWKAFTKRGLGYSSTQGSSTDRYDGMEAFDLPLAITKTTATATAEEGDHITYEIVVKNEFSTSTIHDFLLTDTLPDGMIFISASDGGTFSTGVVSYPLFDLDAQLLDTFTVTMEVKTGTTYAVSDLFDNMENGSSNWTSSSSGSTSWTLQSVDPYSGINTWFAPDSSSVGTAILELSAVIGIGDVSKLSFYHKYDTEAQWDGGQVLISIDDGDSWEDLGPEMVTNGYNGLIFNSIPGFSGNSFGYINTIIDLSKYGNQNVLIRFQMNCDQFVGGNGWWIDDFAMSNIKLLSINQVFLESGAFFDKGIANAVELIPDPTLFQVLMSSTDILCFGETNGTATVTPTGGSGSYSYLWNDGNTDAARTNLTEGNYYVTIDDGTEQIIKLAIIAEPEILNVSLEATIITNFEANNGTIVSNVTGGKTPYTYNWSNGMSTPTIQNLVEIMYSVTITDINGCEKIDSIMVEKYGCDDDFFDSGGSGENYSHQEDITTVICPDNFDEAIKIVFNSIDIEVGWDALYIHNGPSINSPLYASNNGVTLAGFPAGGYYGTSIPGPFTSTDTSGCITVRFMSDQAASGTGWDTDLSCTTLCAEEVSNVADDGWGSLRRQVLCADPIDVIAISSTLNMDTIGLLSQLTINKDLIIDIGIGNSTTIDIGGTGPIFLIDVLGKLELNRIKIIAGSQDPAGAILNNGMLILKDVEIFENNGTPNPDGLILNNGQLNIQGNTNLKKE
jgi:uncharacterized repeat protein (TIGR01451 family)